VGHRRTAALLLAGALIGAFPVAAPAALVSTPAAHPYDFPDPALVVVPDGWRAFSTNVEWTDVPVIRSEDAASWSPPPEANGYPNDAIADLPSWAVSTLGRTWAPDVEFLGGQWVLYFTTAHAESDLQCTGVAVADTVDGPYTPVGDAPFVCPRRRGGAIDASVFSDREGAPWLVWKDDGNCCGLPAVIRSRQLTPDGLGFVGAPVALLRADRPNEAGIVEGPNMVRRGRRYYLFYGANRWQTSASFIGYARCDGPAGPCTKARPGRWLVSGASGLGPAGPDVATDTIGQRWFAFHAWDPARPVGYDDPESGARVLFVRRLAFSGGEPILVDA
jgi:arabinan endo-1,5-alpha-L-arabinosidase